MKAMLLNGNEVAKEVKNSVKKDVEILRKENIYPGLAVVLVGNDPASKVYVRNKGKNCEKLGIFSQTFELPEDISQKELNTLIDKLNYDPKFHGILVQMPLPKHLNVSEIIHRIRPEKDVDGFHPENMGRLVLDEEGFRPCTPAGIMEIFRYYQISLEGKHAVVVGRSNIVGKPMLNMLYQKKPEGNATATICHTRTKDIAAITRMADILIVAAGTPEFITGDMIKPGAVVVDVGMNRVDDPRAEKGYRLTGDVKFDEAVDVASAITPVPGGVGPMTIAMLMVNTVKAAKY
ncbi:MAG: bifunctional methylenetetrahydrofolate dehydrogenase/methenyltetrahydrofolate cyclohydrolase FolD [Candidatus Marinimicrobia bacterium]|nr:bifunctional methylenetetrahydrofolate dehydrogenase/methenyltetrahydrofolate cyclohydrolase FolD [Candidatus Neomarinimicrobiota bacterium]